ncbi:MAG: cytochrome c maturation protein CcmE [Hydrogenovibrio sp.]|uniref:cytochrome c maturation protein CcmE n=1 Tax=Hydrogenovibrio sp. TaxID=2065821 RepID=UPI0028707520|nr:cytochrome c maturation protein CcmE [Hydrogenovibrio sp.]MDR9498440.1 cytochrome c maturation protein CcmE [Hydrogenovibrio sp.]
MRLSRVRQKRVLWALVIVLGAGLGAFMMLQALQKNVMYFYSVSELHEAPTPPQKTVRLGGVVASGSLEQGEDLAVTFAMTDYAHSIRVDYQGLLPNLFREGQGVIATGFLDKNGRFVASELLAKHDEEYMPPEVAESLQGKVTPP